MFDITWTIGGRRIDPASLDDETQRAIVADVTERLRQTLGGVVCPDHGKPPREVAIAGQSFEQFGFQINGCCLRVREAAVVTFRQAQEDPPAAQP